MSDTNVAQDQIKAFVDRILRMKEERKAIDADIREIYAEAKGNGFDKTVLGKLVTYVEKRQTDAAAVMESESIFDLYLTAYDSAAGNVGTKRATHTHASEKPDPIAALRADPAMSIVDAANLKSKTSVQKVHESPEQQASPQPASDLAMPQGQVAPIRPETANEAPLVVGDGVAERRLHQASPSNIDPAGTTAETSDGDDQHLPAEPVPETDKSVEASASAAPASKYAAPGVVTWETFPPEGVERGSISMAFGTMGQDTAVIADELERGAAQPIVKKGNVILDGWARFMAARNMRELDGSPMAYPVVQYDGSDLLVDIIRLNVDGRILNDDQKRKIAANLARQEPSRKGDIYKAFEIFLEPV